MQLSSTQKMPKEESLYLPILSTSTPMKGRLTSEQIFIMPPIKPIITPLAPSDSEKPVIIGVISIGLAM